MMSLNTQMPLDDPHAAMPLAHHLRATATLHSEHATDWQGYRPRGLYFVKTTLKDNPAGEGRPVLLMPGGFDPLRGAYSDELIHGMLRAPGVGSVWEAHYRYQGQCGFGYAPFLIDDITAICARSATPPLVVGMSGGSLLLAAGLLLAAQHQPQPTVKAALILGMYLPGFENLFVRLLLPYYRRPSMQERINRHCGHPYLLQTDVETWRWWDTQPEFRRLLENPRMKSWDRFPVPVELLFFRIDTLSRRGIRRMHELFDCTVHPRKIPGHHRSLRRDVPLAEETIIDFCRRQA